MPLKIYKRGDIWHYRGTVAGRKLRGSTKTASKEIAARIASEIEARYWKGHLDGPGSVLTFAQAAILYREAGKSDRFLNLIEDHWKDTLVREITAGKVRQAALKLYPAAGPATRNRSVIVPTQAVINHAAGLELCPHLTVQRFPVPKKEKRAATWEWVQAFMAVAPPHLGALACFMFLTGARISEALALEWEDLDLPNHRALIRQTKVASERWAHLPSPLVVAIANVRHNHATVFRYASRGAASKSWDYVIKSAGLPHLSPHACRHGFATSMLHAGIDPVTVAKRGGWKSPQHIFSTYGHAMDDPTVTDVLVRQEKGALQARSKKISNNIR